jgi:hypothetical protein
VIRITNPALSTDVRKKMSSRIKELAEEAKVAIRNVRRDGNTAAGLKHVGRFVVTPKQISIAEDSIKPSQTLAKLPADLKSGVWHKLHLEWNGDQIAIQLDELALQARHAFLATPKTRSWIAVGGQTASIRGLKISGKP